MDTLTALIAVDPLAQTLIGAVIGSIVIGFAVWLTWLAVYW